MNTATHVHTAHPCGAEGCTSTQLYVVTDPTHERDPNIAPQYDAVSAHWLEFSERWSYSLVSRNFGAESFATREAAEAFAARVPFPVVVTPWGTRHDARGAR